MIAGFHTLAAVTPFALARRLAELGELAAVQFLRVVMPIASELHAGDDLPRLRQLYLVSSRVALSISVLMTVTLIVAGPTILTLWVGARYAEHAHLLTLLAVATLFGTSQWPAAEILLGMARHRIVAITSCLTGVGSIVISILLLPWLGVVGVALGALIPAVIASLCVVVPFANRILRVSAATMVREVWGPAVIPGFAAALALWIGERQATGPNVVVFVAAFAAASFIYGVVYLVMPAADAERRLLADLARRIARGPAPVTPELGGIGATE